MQSIFRASRVFVRPFGVDSILIRFASTKSGGSTRNGRDSPGQRLGLKKTFRNPVIVGNIIVRQRGKTYLPGVGVGLGRDYTIFAMTEGYVTFTHDKHRKQTVVHVVPYMPSHDAKPKLRQSRRDEEEKLSSQNPKLAAIIQNQRENMELLVARKAKIPKTGVRDIPAEDAKKLEEELETQIMWELYPEEMKEVVEASLRSV